MRIKQLLGVIVAATCAGCGSTDWMSLDNKGNAGGASAAPTAQTTPVGPAVTAPPMMEGNEFNFAGYSFRLPKQFEQGIVPPGGPPNVTVGAWKGTQENNYVSAFTIASINDAKEAARSKKDIRQTLVDFSGAATNGLGIKIALRSPTKTIDANGFKISYFQWSGMGPQVSSDGAAYGFVDGNRVICMLYIGYGQGASQATSEITNYMATFKRK